jgi:hypothetical protein
MKSDYAGWWNEITITLKGLNPFARVYATLSGLEIFLDG